MSSSTRPRVVSLRYNEQPNDHHSSFGCHIAFGNVAPGVVCDHGNGGGEIVLAHLGW